MPDIGGLEVVLFTLVLWSAGVLALYWVIRLAVRHGIQDARRQDLVGAPAANGPGKADRQRTTYDSDSG